jgi:hypothetical protein
MKKLLSVLSVALSFSALASTVDMKTFIYDGSVSSTNLLLSAEKTHTEYRMEQRQSTCYRTELRGYRTVCTGGGYGGGYGYPGRHPRPHPRPVGSCWSEPVYVTVAYSCIQTVSVPFEVKDYDVEARVNIDINKLSPEATPGETFKVTLAGDQLSFEAIGSKKFFIVKKKQDMRSSMNGSVKMIDSLLSAELVESSPVLKALNLANISIENGILSFDMGPVENNANIGFALKITKKKLLGSDPVLLDRDLLNSEIEVKATSSGSEADINVNKLGVELSDGKFSLTAKAFAKFNGNLMNTAQFNELSSSRTLIYKVR